MIICHLHDLEIDAKKKYKDFVSKCVKDNRKIVFTRSENAVNVDGDTHVFIGKVKYVSWCKGRVYILDGKKMHSGYEVKETG